MKNQFILIFLCLFFFQNSCKRDKQESNTFEKGSGKNIRKLSSNRADLNVSILLDLSDRIDPDKYPNPAMDYYERDIGYIKSIAEAFELHLRNKKSITINDNIQIFISPEPSDPNLNEKIQKLRIGFDRNNATKIHILETSKKYDSLSTLIYQQAIKDDEYIGSDIWRFFRNNLKDFCIQDGHRNLLIILTDGYMYHKHTLLKEKNQTSYLTPQYIRTNKLNSVNWEDKINLEKFGFIPATDQLDDIEILVLGINPHDNNIIEEEIIVQYWTKWLSEMEVSNFEIKAAELPSNMDQIISEFILNE